jgi:hypothetical protein
VFLIHTGGGVCKIDAEGKLTYIYKVYGGGHFLALDTEEIFSTQFPQLFKKITPEGVKPALLYASGGAPFVVNRDGNLYYGSGYPGGGALARSGLTLTRLSPDGKRGLFAPSLKATLAKLNEAVTGLADGLGSTPLGGSPRLPTWNCLSRRFRNRRCLRHGHRHRLDGREEREIAVTRLCWCPPGRSRTGSPSDET